MPTTFEELFIYYTNIFYYEVIIFLRYATKYSSCDCVADSERFDPDQAKLCASFGSESPTLVHCITQYSKQNLLSIQQNLNIDM